jgi:hypothetical protein
MNLVSQVAEYDRCWTIYMYTFYVLTLCKPNCNFIVLCGIELGLFNVKRIIYYLIAVGMLGILIFHVVNYIFLYTM